MDSFNYKETKEKMKSDIGKIYNNKLKARDELLTIRGTLEEAIDKNQEEIDSLKKINRFIQFLPDSEVYEPNQNVKTLMNSGVNITNSMVFHSFNELGLLEITNTNIDFIYGSTAASATTSASVATILSNIGEEICGVFPLEVPLKELSAPTPFEQKGIIEAWLTSIDPLLSTKFQEVFNSLTDKNYMSAAHAMREVLSNLEQQLAPDEQIKMVSWYKQEHGTNGPTQRQRIKYSIIGRNQGISDIDLQIIETLAEQGRDIYTQLSNEAHRRKGNWDEHLVNSYLSIGESIIKQIMELRKKFFKES
jgi:hypothetical protein